MMSRLFAEQTWLWPVVWQSTTILALGLTGCFILRRRPVRAHQFLLMALVAAAMVPALTHVVRQHQWGLLRPGPTAVNVENDFVAIGDAPPRSRAMSRSEAAAVPTTAAPRPAATQRSATARISSTRLVLCLWLVASVTLLVRLAIRLLLAYRLARRSAPLGTSEITRALEDAKAKLGIKSDVKMRCSEDARTPVIWCWAKHPWLLVPEKTVASGDIDWQSVISHELAHWKRRDHLSGCWAELICCALPWHPLSWWAKHCLINLSEEACDDWVIASGQMGTGYARTLLTLTPRRHATLVPAVVASKRGLGGRIRRILADQCASPHSGLKWTGIAVIIVGLITIGIAFAQTRPATPQTGEPVPSAAGQATPNETIDANAVLLRLIDADGRPVAGAKAATGFTVRERAVLGSRLNWHQAEVADEAGAVTFDIAKHFRSQGDYEVLYILHEDRKLGALLELARDDAGKEMDVRLAPVCRVHATLDSPDLKAIDMPLSWANTYVRWQNYMFASQTSHEKEFGFDFLLPPGEYVLMAYGSGGRGEVPSQLSASTEFHELPVNVPPDTQDLDLGTLDLPPTKLATLIGKPAPELGPIKAWKNGAPVTLADLKGQFVYLYFDGDSPNTSRDLPPLVELHEALGDKGLTIIALYNCASLEELDRNWEEVHQRFGGVTEVPFRMAVDGGEPSFYAGTDRERPGATYGRYDITSIPTSVLIDPEGNVMGSPNLFYAKETIAAMLGVTPNEPESEAWRAAFNALYRLEEGEILRRIAPPFIPERMDFYETEHAHQAEAIPRGPDHMTFYWNKKQKNWGMGFGRAQTLGDVLNGVVRLKRYEYDGPEALLGLELPGDWIIRNEMPVEVKLGALEALLEAELGRRIRFETRTVERQVIVATGRFAFRPPVDTYENTSVHMYADIADPDERSGGGTADSLAEFLQDLGDRVSMPVIDRTDPGQEMHIPYRHHGSSAVAREPDEEQRARKLRLVLDHLTEQTNLTFNVETQPTEVWFVTEDKAVAAGQP